MRLTVRVLRSGPGGSEQKLQTIYIDTESLPGGGSGASAATLLRFINSHPEITDTEGNAVGQIGWECNCLQKKCGTCAMRVNGTPALACGVKLSSLKGEVLLEPLRKFPVIRDLITDRSVLYEQALAMRTWTGGGEASADVAERMLVKRTRDTVYEASKCLQCGCCVEVCPNYVPGGDFYGTAAAVPFAKTLALRASEDKGEQKARRADYASRVFEGCGKSLACRSICPAGIDVDGLLVKNTGAALWNMR